MDPAFFQQWKLYGSVGTNGLWTETIILFVTALQKDEETFWTQYFIDSEIGNKGVPTKKK